NQASLEAANHSIDQATASLRDSQSLLSKTTNVAPMSGRVTRLSVEQGETAIQGTFNKDAATMLTISDMSVLETKVKVDETDVSRIKIGDSAVIQLDAFPDTTFIGRVSEISNSSVKGASTGGTAGSTDQAIDYEVTIRLLNAPPETRPDFSSTAKIITSPGNNVLSIPIIALTVREDSVKPDTALTLARKAPTKQVGKRDIEGVFVVGANNKVTFRPVKVGIAGEKYFEVLNGLKEGENIVGGTYQAIREHKDGANVRAQKEQPKKREFCCVLKTFTLLPRATALHIIELPLVCAGVSSDHRRRRGIEALERVQLGDRVQHRPNELSGGQRQLVAISRALVNQPWILLADEPTGNLDSTTSEEIMRVFEGLAEQVQTVIMVTHESDIAAHARRVI